MNIISLFILKQKRKLKKGLLLFFFHRKSVILTKLLNREELLIPLRFKGILQGNIEHFLKKYIYEKLGFSEIK